MIYELTFKDKIMRALIGSRAEITPREVFTLKEDVDPERLKKALKESFSYCPLFGCTFKYDRRWYLESIDAPLPVFELSEKDEPLTIGRDTNGYLFYIGYKDRTFFISVCHALTDGGGMCMFYQALLSLYFGLPVPSYINPDDALNSTEQFCSENVQGFVKREQQKGFDRADLPYNQDRQDVSDVFVLSAPTASILAASKKANASPATILAPLFCRALRAHIKPGTKNRNVSLIMPVDVRRPLRFGTQHNGFTEAYITYIDRMDRMDIDTVSTVYRGILDLAAQPESIIESVRKLEKQYGSLMNLPQNKITDAVYNAAGIMQRQSRANTVLSYVGKVSLPPEIIEKIESSHCVSWPQFGDSNLAVRDFDGTMFVTLTMNYKDKTIVKTFMNLCRDVNINWCLEDSYTYRMPVYREK